MSGMFGFLRLDVIGVWGREDPSRSYVVSHLGFLLTKEHHYNDHFPALIYVPYLGTLLILHRACNCIVSSDENQQAFKDPLHVLVGSITKARSKKIKEALNRLIQEIWADSNARHSKLGPKEDKSVINLIQAIDG